MIWSVACCSTILAALRRCERSSGVVSGASGLGLAGLRSGSSTSSVSVGNCLSTPTTVGSFHQWSDLFLATLRTVLPISMSDRAMCDVGGRGPVGRNVGFLVFMSSGQLLGYGALVDFGSSSGNVVVR